MMEGGDEISLDGEEELEDGALSHVTNTRIVKLEAREEAPLKNNMVKVILKIKGKHFFSQVLKCPIQI